jgi:hypothetical protein
MHDSMKKETGEGFAAKKCKEKIKVKDFVKETQEAVESSNLPKRACVQRKDIDVDMGDVVKRRSVAEMSSIVVESKEGML